MVGLPQKVPKAQIVGDWQTFGRHITIHLPTN